MYETVYNNVNEKQYYLVVLTFTTFLCRGAGL